MSGKPPGKPVRELEPNAARGGGGRESMMILGLSRNTWVSRLPGYIASIAIGGVMVRRKRWRWPKWCCRVAENEGLIHFRCRR
jgi:hypothetical protein